MAESSLSALNPTFAYFVSILLEYANSEGLAPVVTETYRSAERQNELYAQGRTAPGAIVTKAIGGQSAHQWGLAADVTSAFGYGSTQARRIREIAQLMGFGTISWDEPHVEWPNWKSALQQAGYSL